jgi:hypothetical protein
MQFLRSSFSSQCFILGSSNLKEVWTRIWWFPTSFRWHWCTPNSLKDSNVSPKQKTTEE